MTVASARVHFDEQQCLRNFFGTDTGIELQFMQFALFGLFGVFSQLGTSCHMFGLGRSKPKNAFEIGQKVKTASKGSL